LIKDHRPYYLKRLSYKFERWYANHFLAPQCEYFGRHLVFMKPWGIEIYGGPVSIGDHTTLIATMDRRIRLTSWMADGKSGKVDIGRHCLVCPGTRILSATSITIDDDCMMAQNVCITDADWHDLYDRSSPIGNTQPVVIDKNVWIGDSAMVCKGVHIGENAIIGAGSIVTKDVPANAIAAGNPASVVRYLDTDKPMRTRSQWMSDPKKVNDYFDAIERVMREKNTMLGWIRAILFPRKGD
jgi:acetyltransferase-like isoleucine patch superfamily enzyme